MSQLVMMVEYQSQFIETIKGNVMTEYIVWVGGTEIGQYRTEAEADEVAFDWEVTEGYKDTVIEEIEVDDETPEQMNARLLSMGY